MIDKGLYRDLLNQLRHSTHVVAVEMRDYQVIDLLDTGRLRSCTDPLGITAIEPGPAGIDKHRLLGRRNQQCCLPALDVDEVNIQSLCAAQPGGSCQKHNEITH